MKLDAPTAAVVSAVIAAAVSWLVSVRTTKSQQKTQLEVMRHEYKLQEDRLKEELRTEYAAEAAIQQLLTEGKALRSFVRIKARIGGFKDDELRKLLVRAGALRFESRDGMTEFWGLRSQTGDQREREASTGDAHEVDELPAEGLPLDLPKNELASRTHDEAEDRQP